MAVERARVQAVPRPWGVVDLSPWGTAVHDGAQVGEIWYQRPEPSSSSSLLLKLLFTSEPLPFRSIPTTHMPTRLDFRAARLKPGMS